LTLIFDNYIFYDYIIGFGFLYTGGCLMDTLANQSMLKRYIKPALITLAILIVIGLLFYLLGLSFNLIVFQRLYSYIVSKIVGVIGISQWLVKGIVIIVLIPVLWVVPNLFIKKYRKAATVVGLLYFSVFFLLMFFLSRDVNFSHSNQEVLKWYALTPEGVKLYDSPGVDPVYGITLKPVTPDMIQKLKLLQKGEFKPIDPSTAKFFNPITGETQVWFYQYPDGKYEFYDKPGYHPITGDQLKPVTKQVYFEWRDKEKSQQEKTEPAAAPAPEENPTNTQTDTRNTTLEENSLKGRYPEASTRLLSAGDLENKSAFDLKIMRNEIFARHGFIFKTNEMKKYFSKQSWYTPKYPNVDNLLSNVEMDNINAIRKYENMAK
jgi:hypothetical protein